VSSIALLYPAERDAARFSALFDAFAAAGIRALHAPYSDETCDDVEAQLRGCAVVQVWFNPFEGGRRRDQLDAMLRRVADSGVVVSAHPDAILKLGTKDVLHEARDLAFGSDVHRIDSLAQLEAELPARLRNGPRVLKQYRGHSGIGVWRVEGGPSQFKVRQAPRGSEEATMDIAGLVATMAPYFERDNGGHMIDQAWQPQLADGMVRAYLVGDRVAGFGHQAVNAFAAPVTGPRLYYAVEELPQFHGLKQQIESQWLEQLCACVGLPRSKLPLLWDCDFIGKDHFVLCEINVSSVSPFPPSAIEAIVTAVKVLLDDSHTH
jgi:hypothetical protein